MKRNAIARIIIFSLIIIVLLSVLLIGLGVGMFTYQVDYDTGHYNRGGSEIPAATIQNIEIEWASGSITVETADTDLISFREEGGKNSEPMVYRQTGDTLTIEYQASKIHFGFSVTPSKDLIITVPNNWNCGELTVDAASADLTVNGLTADEVELNMASGNTHFTDCNLHELNVDSASGEVYYSGTLYNMDCDSASGNINAIFENIPKSIDFDGVSAELELALPADAGFTVEMEALSGDFSSDFEFTRRNGQYVCGDGACKINVDGVSGDVTIRMSNGA